MANLIKFLRGSQTNLNNLITSGDSTNAAGAFYLTEDTNRLYIGKTVDGKVVPVPVNQGVVYVANIEALPSGDAVKTVKTGEFYYAQAENILCVRSADKWIQINTPYNDSELKEVIGAIEDAISGINETLKTKADLEAPAFTGKATLALTKEQIVDDNQLVTKAYVDASIIGADMTEYIDGEIDKVEKAFGETVQGINDEIAGVDAAVKELQTKKADLADANFTKASIGGKAIATQEYADGVAGTKAGEAKEAVIGTATTYTDLGKVESKIEALVEADATLGANLANYVTKQNGEFTSVPTIKITNGETTTTKTVATTTDIDTAKSAVIGDAADGYNTLGKIEDKIEALDQAYKGADALLSNSVSALTTRVSNLENVTDFVGVTETELTDGSATVPVISGKTDYTPSNGDVVIYDGDEFVWSDGKWYKFGAANATNVIINSIVDRLDDIDGTDGDIANINEALGKLEDADAGFEQRLDDLDGTNGAIARIDSAIEEHIEAYEQYKIAAKEVTDKIAGDLADAVEDLGKEDGVLAEAIATEKAAREQLAKDLEWGSF